MIWQLRQMVGQFLIHVISNILVVPGKFSLIITSSLVCFVNNQYVFMYILYNVEIYYVQLFPSDLTIMADGTDNWSLIKSCQIKKQITIACAGLNHWYQSITLFTDGMDTDI